MAARGELARRPRSHTANTRAPDNLGEPRVSAAHGYWLSQAPLSERERERAAPARSRRVFVRVTRNPVRLAQWLARFCRLRRATAGVDLKGRARFLPSASAATVAAASRAQLRAGRCFARVFCDRPINNPAIYLGKGRCLGFSCDFPSVASPPLFLNAAVPIASPWLSYAKSDVQIDPRAAMFARFSPVKGEIIKVTESFFLVK